MDIAPKEILAEQQFGVGVGGERAVHQVRAYSSEGKATIFFDFKNAFNAITRAHLLAAAYADARLAGIWRLLDACYANPTPAL